MTKTEKLNLPQWEASDVFSRTDFNDAFSALDDGYASAIAAAEEVEPGVFARLCRAAYNHYYALQQFDTFPRQLGAFHQGFETDGSVTGMVRRETYLYTGLGTETVNSSSFRSLVTQVSKYTLVKDSLSSCTALVLTFTPPCPGAITNMSMKGSFSSNADKLDGTATLTITDTTTGTVERSETISLGITGVAGTAVVKLLTSTAPFYFHGGHSYRMAVTPLDANFTATFTFTDSTGLLVSPYHAESAQVTHTFSEDESGTGLLAVVHYNTYEQPGTIDLLLDGESVPLTKSRTVIDQEGNEVQELVYTLDAEIPATAALTLKLTNAVYGEMALYRWGAMLL